VLRLAGEGAHVVVNALQSAAKFSWIRRRRPRDIW
jgi:hypothetical protein